VSRLQGFSSTKGVAASHAFAEIGLNDLLQVSDLVEHQAAIMAVGLAHQAVRVQDTLGEPAAVPVDLIDHWPQRTATVLDRMHSKSCMTNADRRGQLSRPLTE